jgi:Fe-S-cluster-containing dehydrogenase component
VPAGPASWISVKTIEKGNYPDLFVAFLPTTCYHCKTPACVSACPVEAITKRDEDGIVTVDRDACRGNTDCGQCLEACSFSFFLTQPSAPHSLRISIAFTRFSWPLSCRLLFYADKRKMKTWPRIFQKLHKIKAASPIKHC